MMFAMDQIDYRQISQIRQALECLAFSLVEVLPGTTLDITTWEKLWR